MGTEVTLAVDAPPSAQVDLALAAVEEEFERLEQVLSRFRNDSELSELNRRGTLICSDDLTQVVALAVAARERTSGRFDPTVHDAVESAGYDRSFEHVPREGVDDGGGARCGGVVRIDAGVVELGPGVRLDLGGIGKGYAVDRATSLLACAGPCFVNAGGDVRVEGACSSGTWPIEVELPEGSLVLGLDSGALATSGRDRRRWRRNGVERHHLIDPETGRSATGPYLRVTVAAATAAEAEVLAKDVFLGGDTRDVTAVLVTGNGRVLRTGELA
jgi:thiamine biosynthesis lipoprotein